MRTSIAAMSLFREQSEIATLAFAQAHHTGSLDLAHFSFSPHKRPRNDTPTATPDSLRMKEAVSEVTAEILATSPEYQRWRERFATVSSAQQALRQNDAVLFDLIAFNLQGQERLEAQLGFVLSDEVSKTVKGMVRSAKATGDREKLFRASTIALAALQNEIGYEIEPVKGVTTQTLIVELHQRGLYRRSAQIVEAALERGISLKSETILSTLSLIGKAMRTKGHVAQYARLAKAALAPGVLPAEDPRVSKVFDVVLAHLGSPEVLSNSRSGRFLGERGLLEVTERLQLASQIGFSVAEAGIPFDTERNEARMNMLIRGLVTGAMGLSAQSLKLLTPGDRSYHQSVDKYFELDVRYPWIHSRTASEINLPRRAEELISAALALANKALVFTTSTDSFERESEDVQQRYNLQGSTINAILKGVHDSGMFIDGSTAVQIGALVEKALTVPSVAKKLHSRQLTLGIQSMLSAESEVAHYEAVRILASALNAGFGFRRELIEEAYQKSDTVNQFDEPGQQAVERLERIIFKPAKVKNGYSVGAAAESRPRLDLRGGLSPLPESSKYVLPGQIPFLVEHADNVAVPGHAFRSPTDAIRSA